MTTGDQLEASLERDLDNDELWAVYADRLQADGDPRGELAAIQLAMAAARTDELRAREVALLAGHPELVPPELAIALAAYEEKRPGPDASDHARHTWDEDEVSVTWHAGFLRTALLSRGDPDYPVKLPDLVADVLGHPSARFLRELVIGPYGEYGEYEYQDVVEAIGALAPRSLRSLTIAEYAHAHSELSWSELGDLEAMWPRLPNLERLRVRGGSFELGAIDLPALRRFEVETSGLSAASINSVCSRSWPHLEHLELYFGSEQYGAEGTIEMLAPIIAADGFPRVRSLGLANAEFEDEIAEAVSTSVIAKQLEHLDLSLGTMTRTGADALVRARAAFVRLRRLDLDGNHIDDEAASRLLAAYPFADLGVQGDMEFRYVKLGE